MIRIIPALVLALAPPLLAVAAPAQPAHAQGAVAVRAAGPGWLGITYDVRWLESDGGCAATVFVDGVAQGSPAQRAGVRAGDVVRVINGDHTPAARLRVLPGLLAPGDSVRLGVERGGAVREIIAIAERRPDRPTGAAPGVSASPLLPLERRLSPASSQALTASRELPVVYLASGDRIMAANLEAGRATGRVAGYWLVTGQEQPVYRSLPARPRTSLDVRVANLLSCAAEASRALPGLPTVRGLVALDAGHIRERAESLRVVIAQRANEHRDVVDRERLLRDLTDARRAEIDAVLSQLFDQLGAPRPPASGDDVFGAHVVAMEQELAAYFQGARGLLVVRVLPGSPAQRSGLRPGDVVTAAAGRPIATPADLRAVLAEPGPARTRAIELDIVRQGRRQTVSLPRP
jgi:membrane-associated protease RseP (regulator of RpoE activity)